MIVGTVCGPKEKGSFDYYSFSDFITHFYESTQKDFKKSAKKTEEKISEIATSVMKKSRDHAEYLNQKMTTTLETELQKVSQQFKDCDGVIEKNMAKLAKEVKRCEAVNTRVQTEFQSMSDTLEREGLRIETAEASLK